MTSLKHVDLYAHGTCKPNPGPGGYGVVLVHNGHRREASGGFRLTSNYRMELMAGVSGLMMLRERCHITLHSDSEYLVVGMEEWMNRWQARYWRNRHGEIVKNLDLWERLVRLRQDHEIEYEWVRGHDDSAENRRCEQLARSAILQSDLQVDSGYEARTA
jgi:ribonuclease HI